MVVDGTHANMEVGTIKPIETLRYYFTGRKEDVEGIKGTIFTYKDSLGKVHTFHVYWLTTPVPANASYIIEKDKEEMEEGR